MRAALITYTLLVGACGFRPASGTDDASIVGVDAASRGDGAVAMPDGMAAQSCFGNGSYKVCLTTLPTGTLELGNTTVITDACANGEIVVIGNGAPKLCVLSGTSVMVTGTVRGVGTLPLAIVATSGDLTIMGTIDVSSANGGTPGAGANDSHCTPSPAGLDGDGAGGGAGGSFGTKGGNGGNGTAAGGGIAPNSSATPTFVRGGCAGGKGGTGDDVGGNGGAGGGASFLLATGALSIVGTINASGAGGSGAEDSHAGGGGGGSGGMIALYAGGALTVTGSAFANGGGGGGGADNPGTNGGESPSYNVAGARGAGGSSSGSNGGAGAISNQTGVGGVNGGDGAGAGGAGGGVVKVVSGQSVSGANISPPPA
ncbi:MAG: hypothetical protein ABI467_13445 [Kofleriaceae bacterium]